MALCLHALFLALANETLRDDKNMHALDLKPAMDLFFDDMLTLDGHHDFDGALYICMVCIITLVLLPSTFLVNVSQSSINAVRFSLHVPVLALGSNPARLAVLEDVALLDEPIPA